MANGDNAGSSNTAIVAIVVLILAAVIAFFLFFNPTGTVVEEEGPDVEIEVSPEGGGGGDSL